MEKLPIGSGHELASKRREAILPALEVKNTVIWKNPAFPELPFNIQLGKQTQLGVFFTANPAVYTNEKVRTPAIMPEYQKGRSGLMGSVVFQDREGHLWRDVDAKGIGHVEGKKILPVSQEASMGDSRKYLGLCDYEFAERDRNYSEKFLKAGIRTHRVVAIIDLEELIDETGGKISLDETRKRNIIGEDMHPVIQVRAFGTKERIDYLRREDNSDPARPKTAFQDAKALVAQERGIPPKNFSDKQYLAWFAETLGQQVAKIRKLDLYHGYLSPHNITLDCRIVDLDSVATTKEHLLSEDREGLSANDLYTLDLDEAGQSLNVLHRVVRDLSPNLPLRAEDLIALYIKSYEAELSRRGQKRQHSTLKKKPQKKKSAT